MKSPFRLKNAVLVMALASAYPLPGHSAAGVAQFAAGDVNVRRGGNVVALAKGRDLESGDAVTTGATGRVQIRFTDGGFVSLQPNSEFAITRYVDANDGKKDSFLVNFARGSMRAITGLIGKRNNENYRVQTATATIGIRGSGFSAGYNADGSLSVTSELGEIEVCTTGGCVRLTVGETALVVSNTEPPVRSLVRAQLPTPGPRQDVVIAGNKVTAGGLSAIVTQAPVIETVGHPWSVAVSTSSTVLSYPNSLAFDHYGQFSTTPGGAQIDTYGSLSSAQLESFAGLTKLNEFAALDKHSIAFTVRRSASGSFSSLGQTADADFLGWGHWATGTFNGGYTGASNIAPAHLHYVVGKPTTDAQMAALSGMTGSYSFAGGTATFQPTGYGGGSALVGTLTGNGALTANFTSGNATINGSVKANFGATVVPISLNGTSVGGKIVCGPANEIAGMFTGATANRLGLVFNKFATVNSTSGKINGSAAFSQTSLVPTGP